MSIPLSTKRHSLSHIMAQAVKSLYGADIQMAIGPDIDTGFYYDFDFGSFVLQEEHLREIEKKMKNIIKQNQKFSAKKLPVAEAKTFMQSRGESYKVEMIDELSAKGETEIGFYENIDQKGEVVFVDMCRGPHVEKTAEIDENSFKIEKLAGAYWRGDSSRKMLTRIYGLAFESKVELDAHIALIEEAKKRDHRLLGKKLKLFTLSELIGAGLPLMQPNGMIIRKEIEEYLWEMHKSEGYDRVWTPHIAKEDLYVTSGHAAKFGDELFRVQGKEDKFIMKPMNCPHHMQIFADNQFSYRDMPIRYFEPATVYRDEKTGQLSGLSRVRSITQDDGHLFCRVSQIKDEVKTIVSIIKQFYTTFGMIDGYWVSLSVRGEDKSKYLGTDEVWNIAEGALDEAAKENGLNYRRIEGEAAFYGPKLDFMFQDALGRERQLATIQCDFNLPERFDLTYTNELGEKERPVVIHRAIAGSLERFMGIMIEHFAGRFPLWLTPTQVQVVAVGEAFQDYAETVGKTLKDAGMRVKIDRSGEGLGKKIRNAESMYVNYILVVGEKEQSSGGVSVRSHKTQDQTDMSLAAFLEMAIAEIKSRSL